MGDSARILVVDDDATMRRPLVEILTRSGYEVVQAADGLEASRLWRECEPDLVIIDLFMPEKDGIETIVELQAFVPGIPIIAISGGGADGSRLDLLKDAQLLGAFLSIEKPFTSAEMLAAVRKALRGGKRGPL